MSLLEDMAQEGASQRKELTDAGLAVVAVLAEQQLGLESKITKLTDELKKLEEEHNLISTNKLPAALDEYGLSEVKLKSGQKIKIKKVYGATIAAKNKERAFKWLREKGFGDFIKRAITTTFGMGEDKKADDLFKDLSTKGLTVVDKVDVHAQTLKAFVKEQKEKDPADKTRVEIPDELFGVFEGKVATIE